MMCDDLVLYHELFIYFDMFYIQWHHLAKTIYGIKYIIYLLTPWA
jgi:hypothetical protein